MRFSEFVHQYNEWDDGKVRFKKIGSEFMLLAPFTLNFSFFIA